MADITLGLAFVAGLASFLSPCILPLVPAFLAYVSGVSLDDLEKKEKHIKRTLFLHSVLFVLGFSVVFALLGALLSSILADISYLTRIWLGRIGGIIIITFGLYLLGLIKLPWLAREHQLKVKRLRYSYLTSFLFGSAFAVGWTPCVGTVLGTVLTLAITQPGTAFGLLLSYAVGLGVPFLIVGAFMSQASGYIAKISESKGMRYFNYIMGAVLIVLGILVFTDNLSKVASYASFFFLVGE